MMDKEQEFNQQEYNKEMEEQLLAHGFEETREGSQIYDCSWNIAEKRIRVSLHNHFPINILFYHDANLKAIVKHNHSMDWIKEQAKFYLGIDLVKKEEKEPLKCTLENAWKGADMAYWINNVGVLDFSYLEIDETNPVRDGNEVRRKGDGEKLLLIPSLMNLINYANRMFPAKEGQVYKYYVPHLPTHILTFCMSNYPSHPFAFASEKAFEFFKEQPENVKLLKRVLTPTL